MSIDKKIASPFYSLNKCNPRLSGNIKFLIDDDSIYIDSIDSNTELMRISYKSYKLNTTNNLMANLKNYAKLFTSKDNIYDIKNDLTNVVNVFSLQHSTLYNSGAYSDTSELVSKRFRYFAPIQINEEAVKPDLFSVYRVDRTKINTSGEYIKELVFVHDFRYSEMGKQLDRHIDYLKNYNHDMGIYVNFGENISYTGTSLDSGLMESRYENDFNSLLANERTITEFNKHIIDGFKRNNLIDSRFLNLEFSFDIPLTDIDMNDKFVDLIGFYGTIDELGSVTEYNNSDYDFKLLDNNTVLTQHNGTLTENDLTDNSIKVSSSLGIQYTSNQYPSEFVPLVMIEPKYIPTTGSRIVLSYNGVTEITYIVKSSDIIIGDIIGTATNIAKSFTEFARINISNLYVSAFIHSGKYLVIKSLIDDNSYNNIKIEMLPQQYKIIEPLFSESYDNTFYSPSDSSVLTLAPIGLTKNGADSLSLNGVLTKIIYEGRWLDYYYYNTLEPLKTSDSSEIFDVIKTEKTKIIGVKLCENRTFDFDRENTYHEDVFDFELVAYKNWLLTEINKSDFLGKYEGTTQTDETIIEYKTKLVEVVNKYFNAIDLQRNMLLKDLDTDSFEATSTTNEFNRLGENTNLNLLKSNMMNQSICKFMYSNGLDVYNRPYTLNINLPFRYDNFAPSLDSINRDLRLNTHSWCIIGEGIPPYFSDILVDGSNAVVYRDIDSDQNLVVIDRFYGNIGNEIGLFNVVGATIISSDNNTNGFITFDESNNSVTRELDIPLTTTSFKFNYVFDIFNNSNTNINIKIELKGIDTNNVYKTFLVNKNIIGGVSTNIDEIHNIELPIMLEQLYFSIKVPVGWSSTILLKDINFYSSKVSIQTFSDTIEFDNDKITGYNKHIEDMLTGYTSKQITTNDILSTTNDVYNYIRSNSIVRLEDGNGTCFFRGLKVVVDSKYNGWRFSSILLTRNAPIDNERSIVMYENNTFKTITIVVNMYIPEPVLTSLEIPNKYWLDRSLLYFSDGDYASEQSLSSFGLENISLRINDIQTPKLYLGNFITNDWYFQQNGINYIYVSKGMISRFNIDFTTFLNLGDDFNVYFANTDDSETVNYGMVVTFVGIQEITSNYFWCNEIHVKIKETTNGITTTIEYDMLNDYLLDNNVFYLKNRMDIVEAIILENAKYDRVLKNTSIIDRFSLLSASSIFDWLNNNKVTIKTDENLTYNGSVSVFKPKNNTAVISLKNNSENNIEKLPNLYTNTFIRQNGLYEPITKLLRPKSNKFLIKNTDYGYSNKASINNILPTIGSNNDRNNDLVWFYRHNFNTIDLSNHYRIYHNKNTYNDLDWFTNPMEYKHSVSRVLSSTNEIKVKYVYDGSVIDLKPLVYDYLVRLVGNSGFDSSIYDNTTKINMLKLGNPNIDTTTLNQYDFSDIIINRFYKSCFSVIYDVSTIYDIVNDKLIDYIEISDDIIRIYDDIEIGTVLEFTINRL